MDSLKHMDLVLGGGRCPMGRYGVEEEPYSVVGG